MRLLAPQSVAIHRNSTENPPGTQSHQTRIPKNGGAGTDTTHSARSYRCRSLNPICSTSTLTKQLCSAGLMKALHGTAPQRDKGKRGHSRVTVRLRRKVCHFHALLSHARMFACL